MYIQLVHWNCLPKQGSSCSHGRPHGFPSCHLAAPQPRRSGRTNRPTSSEAVWRCRHFPQAGAPPVISQLMTPIKYSYTMSIPTINPSYWSYEPT